ncbi:hypothetical protein DBL00_10580 [Klebsiella quasipneumoniae]|nr:hypothetical protein DBL00_10580 [Klebsiella quasipneumoniae]
MCRVAAGALPGLQNRPRFGAPFAPFVGPRKRSAAGQGQRARSRFCAGWRLAPDPAYKTTRDLALYSRPS